VGIDVISEEPTRRATGVAGDMRARATAPRRGVGLRRAGESVSAFCTWVSNSLCAPPIVGITIITLTLISARRRVVVAGRDATIQLSLSPRSIRDAATAAAAAAAAAAGADVRDAAGTRRLSTRSFWRTNYSARYMHIIIIIISNCPPSFIFFSKRQRSNETASERFGSIDDDEDGTGMMTRTIADQRLAPVLDLFDCSTMRINKEQSTKHHRV